MPINPLLAQWVMQKTGVGGPPPPLPTDVPVREPGGAVAPTPDSPGTGNPAMDEAVRQKQDAASPTFFRDALRQQVMGGTSAPNAAPEALPDAKPLAYKQPPQDGALLQAQGQTQDNQRGATVQRAAELINHAFGGNMDSGESKALEANADSPVKNLLQQRAEADLNQKRQAAQLAQARAEALKDGTSRESVAARNLFASTPWGRQVVAGLPPGVWQTVAGDKISDFMKNSDEFNKRLDEQLKTGADLEGKEADRVKAEKVVAQTEKHQTAQEAQAAAALAETAKFHAGELAARKAAGAKEKGGMDANHIAEYQAKLGDAISAASGRSKLSVEGQRRLDSITRLKDAALDENGNVRDNLTGSQVAMIATDAASVMAGGGTPTEAQIKELSPKTWKGDWAHTLDYLTNNPHDAGAQEFVKNYMNMMGNVESGIQKTVKGHQEEPLGGYSWLEKADPQGWRDNLQSHGLNPDDYENGHRKARASSRASPAATPRRATDAQGVTWEEQPDGTAKRVSK